MKRIVNSEEMKFCDSNTIRHFGIPSLVLMERAALCTVWHIQAEIVPGGHILVVCGNGNNGADGLAIARILHQRGYQITAVQMPGGKRSEENLVQRGILGQYGIPVFEQLPEEPGGGYACVVDALFGVGLSRPPKGAYAQWIHTMNRLDGYKVAVDMPSGVSSDTGEAYEAAFCADITVTFAYQKAGQVLYPGREKCGEVRTADIGITAESWLGRSPSCYAYGPEDLYRIPKRPKRSNKGTFGKVLAIAGSINMAGAACFCAQAAYRAGCGLVNIYTPQENRTVLQSMVPEAILTTYMGEDAAGQQLLDALSWADAIILGPGIGTGSQAASITKTVVLHATCPVVVDADGLNILSGSLELLHQAKAELAITPHVGEMARLCQKQVADIQPALLETARAFSDRFQLTCVLKDAATVTAIPGQAAYINTSGCSAMAKGGSGDILAGIVAAFAAQGMKLEAAAPLAVYVHGLAGEAAAAQKGCYSVLARDILAAIGPVLQEGIR